MKTPVIDWGKYYLQDESTSKAERYSVFQRFPHKKLITLRGSRDWAIKLVNDTILKGA